MDHTNADSNENSYSNFGEWSKDLLDDWDSKSKEGNSSEDDANNEDEGSSREGGNSDMERAVNRPGLGQTIYKFLSSLYAHCYQVPHEYLLQPLPNLPHVLKVYKT